NSVFCRVAPCSDLIAEVASDLRRRAAGTGPDCGDGFLQVFQQSRGVARFLDGNQFLVAGKDPDRRRRVVMDRVHQSEVEIRVGEGRIYLDRKFVVQLGKPEIVRVEVEISKVVMSLE